MSAAVYRGNTTSLAIPPTQNTAPVLEFNCLYTHDVRRKQKRWQDGIVRFHTFNKRIMVYDVPRNFVGDTHWKSGDNLQDGDELTLDREGVIVQVAESIGSTETDLTELLQSRKKPCGNESSSPARAVQATASRIASDLKYGPPTQLKHKSLNAMLGTCKGPIGKATLPSRSPFEERYSGAENVDYPSERPIKRPRITQYSAGNTAQPPTTITTTIPSKPSPMPLRTSGTSKPGKENRRESATHGAVTKEVIDLTFASSSPKCVTSRAPSRVVHSPLNRPQSTHSGTACAVRSSSPAFQRQTTPEGSRPLKPRAKPSTSRASKSEPRNIPKEASLPVSRDDSRSARAPQSQVRPTKSHTSQSALEHVEPKPVSQSVDPEPITYASGRTGKLLRMTGGSSRKKTLLCQQQASSRVRRVHSANTENAIDALLHATSQDDDLETSRQDMQRQKLAQRLAKINDKAASKVDKSRDSAVLDHKQVETKRPSTEKQSTAMQSTEKTKPPAEAELPDTATLYVQPEQSALRPLPGERQLRRVVSETNKVPTSIAQRAPGAPVRYTPSPITKSASPATAAVVRITSEVPQGPLKTAAAKQRAKQPIQRSVSLNTTLKGTSAKTASRAFEAPKANVRKPAPPEKPADPWSREAFDLFTWRPPGWDEDLWCFKKGEEQEIAVI